MNCSLSWQLLKSCLIFSCLRGISVYFLIMSYFFTIMFFDKLMGILFITKLDQMKLIYNCPVLWHFLCYFKNRKFLLYIRYLFLFCEIFFKILERFSDGDWIHETIGKKGFLCNLGKPYILGGKALCVFSFLRCLEICKIDFPIL